MSFLDVPPPIVSLKLFNKTAAHQLTTDITNKQIIRTKKERRERGEILSFYHELGARTKQSKLHETSIRRAPR